MSVNQLVTILKFSFGYKIVLNIFKYLWYEGYNIFSINIYVLILKHFNLTQALW